MKILNLIFFANIKHKGFFRIILLGYVVTIIFSYFNATDILKERKQSTLDGLKVTHGHFNYRLEHDPKQWKSGKCNLIVGEKYPNNIVEYYPWVIKFAKLEKYAFWKFANENNFNIIRNSNEKKFKELRKAIEFSSYEKLDRYKRNYCDDIVLDYYLLSSRLSTEIYQYLHPFYSYRSSIHPYEDTFEYFFWNSFYPLIILLIVIHIFRWIILGFLKPRDK